MCVDIVFVFRFLVRLLCSQTYSITAGRFCTFSLLSFLHRFTVGVIQPSPNDLDWRPWTIDAGLIIQHKDRRRKAFNNIIQQFSCGETNYTDKLLYTSDCYHSHMFVQYVAGAQEMLSQNTEIGGQRLACLCPNVKKILYFM